MDGLNSPADPIGTSFLTGGGEMGAAMRAKDWAATPLGPAEDWPQALKTVIRIMLSSRYAMWMAWGPDLPFFCNDAYRPTLGVKHGWALGTSARKVWAEIWKDIGPRIDKVLATGEATWDEGLLLFLQRAGYPEETYHTFSYSPVADDAGQIAGMLCVVTEVTERVIGERRLALLRELSGELAGINAMARLPNALRRAFSTDISDLPFTLTYLLEDDGRRARLACATGVAADTALSPAEAVPGEAAWPGSVLQGPSRTLPLPAATLPAPAGWDAPPHAAMVLPLAAQGQDGPAGFLIAGLNPFCAVDEAYAGFLDLVAGQVAASLGNIKAYEEERKRAEALAEIDRAKTAFFSNVSHEFRTPLTLMLGPLEEMLVAAGPGDRERLEAAHRNGLRLLKLVNSLLDFSRIEAGRAQAAFVETDLGAYTAELAANFRSAMEKAGLAFRVDCPAPLAVHVDRDMWETVVLNLLSNAFKFTFDGEVAVALRPSTDGRAAVLTVTDTGTGIAADQIAHLFERFHRVEGAPGRSFEGSGIGLALVRELVRLHGGTITADSSPGRGTCFTVTLPLGTAHLPAERLVRDAAMRPQGPGRARAYVEEALRWLPRDGAGDEETMFAAVGAAGSASGPPGTGERILLADDNADMRDYISRLLRGAGYSVEAVGTGGAALAAARAVAPDLVLSDVMMPGLDGFGLLRALRADATLRRIPVLLLSARAGDEARIEGLEAGADDYLTKPFSAREMIARVASNLQLAAIRRQAETALEEEARTLEILNRIGTTIAGELDLERAVQTVTDAATALTGAAFGAFFYNVLDDAGARYTLYTISGVPRSAFEQFPMPRNTAVFAPTFDGVGVVRSDDILADPRYGRNAPYRGMPDGHLPVRSYLSMPVVSRNGEVLGGLFFGHPEPARFTERAERLVIGIAAQAAIAIDNARLYQAAQAEIAQRRKTEAELRQAELAQFRLNEILEARVAERTAELSRTNEQLRIEAAERERVEQALRQSQKMEAIGQLTGGVAHDFNNLLTIIIGNLETLQRQYAREHTDIGRVKRAAENAFRGAQRAAALTQRLLAFSRRQPLAPRPVDANKLVATMSDLLRRTLGEGIAIETVLAGGLWRTHADPNQLESAILNLAVNARDAMPGGGRLTIETANAYLDEGYAAFQAEVVPGQYIVIAISDTGTGMTREVVAQAFEPFFTTKGVGHGTGLGLSQVYGFVKQTGGHVKIYSEVGQGTTVKIYLPRLLGEVEDDEDVEGAAATTVHAVSELILVVEDDDDVRAHSVDILTEIGYRVVQAQNGATALDIIDHRDDIALLFTDVGLPGGMNGRQLAEAAQARLPGLKVLFTTGYARNAIVHDGRLDPGVQLITKPFTYAALSAKVRDMLDIEAGASVILVVEDDPLVRMVMAETLAGLGARVEEAATATEAIAKARLLGSRLAAAIVDLGLPDRKGDGLAQELRAMYARLPIIVASGYGQGDLQARLGQDPLISFLPKPYDADQIATHLQRLGIAGLALAAP